MKTIKNTTDNKNKIGYFVFSLDTEFAWGDSINFKINKFSKSGYEERLAFGRLLNLLDEFNIIGTWAIVGHLFYERCEKCDLCPILDWRGKYEWFDLIYNMNSPLWYGADIIEMLLEKRSRQEIAFHGYTHRLFDESTLSIQDANIEILEWKRLSSRINIMPRTAIFPQNKIGYLNLFKESGFICYRGAELMPEIYSFPVVGKILRRFHRYISSFLISNVYELLAVLPDDLVNIPSTQHFFGYSRRIKMVLDAFNMHEFSINQMIKGVQKAADEKKIIHIRAHPLDFKTEKDFARLYKLFEKVNDLVKNGLLESVGMAELAEKFMLNRS